MRRLLSILLIISFQFGYLQWGSNDHMFVFEVEAALISNFASKYRSLLHPFILVPLIGFILHIYNIIKPGIRKRYPLIGIVCLSTLMLMLLFIGLLAQKGKIIVSTLPFIMIAVISVLYYRKIES